MSNIGERLLQIKRDLEKVQNEKARHEGALEMLNKRLKDEFGCNSISEAEALITKMDDKLSEQESELEGLLAELESIYAAN